MKNQSFAGIFMLFAFTVLSLTAFTQAPTSLQYPSPNVYRTNVDMVYIAPTVSGNISTYSITPALSAGLAFNTNTGVISGTPTAAAATTIYTITASNGLGSTNTTISLAIFNYYYNNSNGQVSFLAANAVPKEYASVATAGQTQGDIVLYTNVVTISGQVIDCIVTTTLANNVSSWQAYDQPAVSGSNFNSNSDNFFSPQVNYGTGGGSMVFDFQFILGGSYDDLANTGTDVILQNVKLNTYDIDGNGTAIQYNEFGGFNTSELGTSTNEVVTYNAASGLTRYTSNTATNTPTITDPTNRVRVSYNEMSKFSIVVGADNSGLAFFFLDFSVGGAFTTTVTPTPSFDLNIPLVGVNNTGNGCGTALSFTGGVSQTNAQSPTNLSQFQIRFPTAHILNGANERLNITGATAGSAIALNFVNGAAIANVAFGSTITYAVAATVANGISTLSFTRTSGSSQFTLTRAEDLVDALQYQNTGTAPTGGKRAFTLNIINTNFRSPDAIFTVTLNCVSISGNIYHDANALTDNTVNPNSTMGQFANGSMYGILVDPSTDLVTKTQSITGSAYNFGTAAPNKYHIYFSNSTPPAIGTTFTASTFPAGNFISTGENLGAGAGNDLATDSKMIVTVGSLSVTNANFGVQIPPTATGVNEAGSLNPGGFNFKTVPGTRFGAADADGTVTSVTITSFPTNSNYLKIGNVVYISGGTCPPQSSCVTWPGTLTIPYSGGSPTSSIAVDPIDGNTTVRITYTAADNGLAISTPSFVDIPFTVPATPMSITGNVWNDGNGDGLINGSEVLTNAAISGQTLYAVLVQTTNTYSGQPTVFATAEVSNGSGYNFDNVPAGNDYLIRPVSLALPPVDGSAASLVAAAMAPGYIGVSTNNSGVTATGFNTDNLINTIPSFSASKVNVNFGIERLPTAIGATHSIAQPSFNLTKALTSANGLSMLTGTDEEDGVKGAGSNIRIISISGLNGNILKYNGIPLSANSIINGYNPADLSVTFNGGGSLNASFTFVFIDNAGIQGISPATYTITWSSILAVNLLSFEATPGKKTVKLDWVTANESSIDSYTIQHSADGVRWKPVMSMPATGSGSYTADHMTPLNGINYYRLQIKAQSGSLTYSAVRKALLGGESKPITAWPNPVRDRVLLIVPGNNFSTVTFLNITGQSVLSTKIKSSGEIDMKSMPAGVYMARVEDTDGSVNVIKILKQ